MGDPGAPSRKGLITQKGLQAQYGVSERAAIIGAVGAALKGVAEATATEHAHAIIAQIKTMAGEKGLRGFAEEVGIDPGNLTPILQGKRKLGRAVLPNGGTGLRHARGSQQEPQERWKRFRERTFMTQFGHVQWSKWPQSLGCRTLDLRKSAGNIGFRFPAEVIGQRRPRVSRSGKSHCGLPRTMP